MTSPPCPSAPSKGWHFDFKLSDDTSLRALEADRHTGSNDDQPVHRLRRDHFFAVWEQKKREEQRKSQEQKTSQGQKTSQQGTQQQEQSLDDDDDASRTSRSRSSSHSSSSSWSSSSSGSSNESFLERLCREDEGNLDPRAKGRFEPRWLEIEPDKERDLAIARALEDEHIAQLWEDIALAWDKKLRREIEALPLCLLCNRLRATLRGQSDKKHQDDDGWGSIIPRRYIIQNIDIEETVLDIPIFAQTPSGGDTDDARLEWGNVNALISVSDSPYQDLRDTYTNQAFRRTSRLVERHALWMRSHYVTVSGPLIRLWQFTRTTYCTSRAYDFRKDADRLDIGRILTLLVASDQDSILRQWVPPTIMDVQGPESHGNAATSQTEKWEWLEGSPQVLRVSGEIWQARTTIFAGHARLIVPPGTQPAQDQRLDRLELDGKSSQGRLTLIKCCLLPEHLLGHEHLMQEYVADLPGAPKPIGLLPLDMAPLGPPAMAGQSSAKFYPQALLYQQRMGSELPYDMCEKDFCKLLLHFTGELEEYARRGVHYRNFDPDNLLYAPDDKDGPRVILIGHENMRLDGQSGPSPNAGRAGGDDSDDDPKSLEAIVKDDLHGTHPLLEPSAHSELRWRLKSAEDYRLECASLEQRSREDSARIQRQGEKSYSRLRLYAHSHLDDLESCCYMHLLYVLRRSLQPYDEKRRRLEKNLVEDFTKARMWTKAHEWAWSLSRIFENMSKGWRDMMEELNVTIFTAQEKRRKELEDDPDLMNMPLEALFKLSPTEEECFRACREIYSNYLRDDKLSSKPFVAPLTYWAQEKQKEAQKEMAAAREATGASGAYDAQDEAEVDSGS